MKHLHPLLPRRSELGLPLLSGILLTLSYPPFHLLLPPFVALVPVLVFVGRSTADRPGAVSVRRGAFWMGVVHFGTLLYWLFTALVFYTWLALLGYLITVVVLSALAAGAIWAVHFVRRRYGAPFWVSLPLFWTAAEWLLGHIGDLAFPWLGLGHSLTGFPVLIGFADLTGARGVTVWLAAVNGFAAEWWLSGVSRRWRPRLALLALLIGAPVGYSLWRWHSLDLRPAARVLVVQPNIPEDLRLERAAARDSSRVALDHLTRAGLRESVGVDLIVWPETAHPFFFNRDPAWTGWAARVARRGNTALLFGTLDLELVPGGVAEYFNAAAFFTSEGALDGIYRKHHLVPMVERVPFVPSSWLRSVRRRAARGWRLPVVGDVGSFFRWFGGYGRGSEKPLFSSGAARFGVLICYESIFAGLSRDYRRAGADFVVNITNDAWFGRERPWWSRTSALYQHPAHLVMRAIENRMGVARAANTGISLFVDPLGRVHDATDLFVPERRAAPVLTSPGLTLYSRLGDWPGWLSAAGGLLVLTVAAGRRWFGRRFSVDGRR